MPIRNISSACFCKSECPPGSNPYIKYWLQTDHPTWPEYHTSILYQHVFGELAGACAWQPITKALPTVSEESFDKRNQAPAPNDHAYFMRVNFLVPGDGRFEEFQLIYRWDDADLPITEGVSPSCDQTFVLPSTQEIGWDMTLTPAAFGSCPDDA